MLKQYFSTGICPVTPCQVVPSQSPPAKPPVYLNEAVKQRLKAKLIAKKGIKIFILSLCRPIVTVHQNWRCSEIPL